MARETNNKGRRDEGAPEFADRLLRLTVYRKQLRAVSGLVLQL